MPAASCSTSSFCGKFLADSLFGATFAGEKFELSGTLFAFLNEPVPARVCERTCTHVSSHAHAIANACVRYASYRYVLPLGVESCYNDSIGATTVHPRDHAPGAHAHERGRTDGQAFTSRTLLARDAMAFWRATSIGNPSLLRGCARYAYARRSSDTECLAPVT